METNDLLLVAEKKETVEPLNSYLAKSYQVEIILESDRSLYQTLLSNRHNAVIFSTQTLSANQAELIYHLQENTPKPVLVFTETCSEDAVNQVVEAGANSIIIDGIKEQQLKSKLDIAVAQFNRCDAIYQELSQTKRRLEDRRYIERAKGLLMKMRKISEDEAYKSIRTLSMQKGQRMGDVAQTIMLAAELLDQ